MAAATMNGGEFLASVSEFITSSDAPFKKYLSFGSLLEETWNEQTYDDEAAKRSFKFTSTEGSSTTASSAFTGSEAAGSYKDSVSVTGKLNGVKMSGTTSETWSASSSSNTYTLKWASTGGTPAKDDDFNYNYSYSSKGSWGAKGSFNDSTNINYTDAKYTYKLVRSVNSKSTMDTTSGEVTSNSGTTTFSHNFTDSENKISFTQNGKVNFNSVADSYKFSISNHKIIMAGFTVTTSKMNFETTEEGLASLPQVDPDTSGGDFSVISENILQMATGSVIWAYDNVVTISSGEGIEVDAGAGNDKVTGGVGDDTITAGAGRDSLAGGKGNDTFILSKDDYDFSSTKTLLADTITDFKYITNGEQDTITLEGFDSIESYKTIADAKKAASEAEVIYESSTGKFWYNEDMDAALVGVMNFATIKGIPINYDWTAAGAA